MNLILASESPRRKELMERMGLSFRIVTAEHDETMDPALPPEQEVARVSRCKAEAVAPLCQPEDLIVAADTIVVCAGRVMGKPRDAADAKQMLRLLSGQEHQVMTGLTVWQGGCATTRTVVTRLRFRALAEAEIDAYVATGEPMGKAGSYAVQGLGSMLVEGLEGDYYNVMGLPVCTLALLLRQHGVTLLGI